MYYIRFKTSSLIQLVTCFYYSHSIENPFSSLLINDVTHTNTKAVRSITAWENVALID